MHLPGLHPLLGYARTLECDRRFVRGGTRYICEGQGPTRCKE
jgi:hypothetical protein